MDLIRYFPTYAKEIILLTDVRVAKWRFLFFRAGMKTFLSVKKESTPLRTISTNILDHAIDKESRGVRLARTSLRLLLRGIK